MNKPTTWTETVARGVRSAIPTLNRWLAVAAILQQSKSTWLIAPDRALDDIHQELAAYLPEVEVSLPLTTGGTVTDWEGILPTWDRDFAGGER